MGHEDVELVEGDAGLVERLLADLGHREGRPAEDGVALHGQVRHHAGAGHLVGADDVAPVLALADQVELLAVGAPHDRADARGVAGSDDRRTRAVGEDEGGAAVGEVEDVGEPLDADDQDVAGAAGADEVGGQGDAVAEPGARRGDVEGGGLPSVPSSWAIAVATAGVWSRWLTVATTTQSIWPASRPARSIAIREASTDIIWTDSSGPAQRRDLMPERCWIHSSLESIASTTSELGTDAVGAVGADARGSRACGAAGGRLMRGHQDHALRVEAQQRLAGGDQVAVLDEPLDDATAVRALMTVLSRGLATSPIVAPGASTSRSAASRGAVERALAGETTIRHVGVVSICDASPCLSQKARASSSWSGVLSGERLDALHGALGDAGQRAGGRHLEDAGDAEVDHRLHAEVPAHRAGDLADDAAHHVAAVVDDLAVAVGDHRRARVVGGDRAGQRGQVTDGGPHVAGVEGAGHATAASAAPWRAGRRRRRRAAPSCRRRRSGRGRCRWRR